MQAHYFGTHKRHLTSSCTSCNIFAVNLIDDPLSAHFSYELLRMIYLSICYSRSKHGLTDRVQIVYRVWKLVYKQNKRPVRS